MTTISTFIDAIADYKRPRLFNPWSQSCRLDLQPEFFKQRRQFLSEHLSCKNPACAIIGEAPGWRGARYTGVAFTSEQLIYDRAVPRIVSCGGNRITTQPSPIKEPSATMVWKEIYRHQLQERVVMFNAVPWHPEGKDSPLSNRPPRDDEKKAGLERLELFFHLFPGIRVLALGLTASENLKKLKIPHSKVRHPANGGAMMFRTGMEHFVKNLGSI